MTEPRSLAAHRLSSCSAALIAAVVIAGGGHAARAQERLSSEALAAQATDPTASLMSFQLYNWYTANQVVFRSAIPFELGSTRHIFRLTAPYVTSSPNGDDGFADLTVFDLMTFDRAWGRFGVGVSGTIPTGAEGLTLDQWTAWPAPGVVNSST